MATKKKPVPRPRTPKVFPVSSERLLAARKAKGLRQVDVCFYAHIAPSNYSRLEAGVGPDVQVSTLCRVCEALDVDPNHLLSWPAK